MTWHDEHKNTVFIRLCFCSPISFENTLSALNDVDNIIDLLSWPHSPSTNYSGAVFLYVERRALFSSDAAV